MVWAAVRGRAGPLLINRYVDVWFALWMCNVNVWQERSWLLSDEFRKRAEAVFEENDPQKTGSITGNILVLATY